MAKQKYYVVWEGRKPGIYTSWSECETQVKGYSGARYKSFDDEGVARASFNEDNSSQNKENASEGDTTYDTNSISVDAACSGNPGVLEFRGVDTATGSNVFAFGPFPLGTNNIGEFLGLVHAIENFPGKTIYTDSKTAMAWVRNKKVSTNLPRNAKTSALWKMIDEKTAWLQRNTYSNKILKWDTKALGEIKADFGRK